MIILSLQTGKLAENRPYQADKCNYAESDRWRGKRCEWCDGYFCGLYRFRLRSVQQGNVCKAE